MGFDKFDVKISILSFTHEIHNPWDVVSPSCAHESPSPSTTQGSTTPVPRRGTLEDSATKGVSGIPGHLKVLGGPHLRWCELVDLLKGATKWWLIVVGYW